MMNSECENIFNILYQKQTQSVLFITDYWGDQRWDVKKHLKHVNKQQTHNAEYA